MSKHRLINGISFIDGLVTLGKILGYFVQTEYEVKGEHSSSPVDVAWFKDNQQQFPLFIFEVETKPTNSIAYNPLKVFGKDNKQFEKPLFFFQIILTRGEHSQKIHDLKSQYGTYNFRIYRLFTKDRDEFIVDVLSQHRRLSEKLNITKFFYFLCTSKWLDTDVGIIAKFIESANFERNSGAVLSSFVYLATIFESFIPLAVSLITDIHKDYYASQKIINYQTYIGNTWHFPIHLGLIYTNTTDLYLKNRSFHLLKAWQERNSPITMIGPHFGLNYDYDRFIVWGSGAIFGLLSALYKDNEKIRMYFACELIKIIEKTCPDYRYVNLAWLIHILPLTREGEEKYQAFIIPAIKEIGGLSEDEIINPIFCQDDSDGERSQNSTLLIKSLSDIKRTIVDSDQPCRIGTTQLAFEILTSQVPGVDWGLQTIKAIHAI